MFFLVDYLYLYVYHRIFVDFRPNLIFTSLSPKIKAISSAITKLQHFYHITRYLSSVFLADVSSVFGCDGQAEHQPEEHRQRKGIQVCVKKTAYQVG